MRRSARAIINGAALAHNLQRVKAFAPNSQVNAVIKANAYGHGAVKAAEYLNQVDGFAVSHLNEALELRKSGFLHPITLLQGVQSVEQLNIAAKNKFRVVFHDMIQLQFLDELKSSIMVNAALKIDTGMHRLGIAASQAGAVYQKLISHPNIKKGAWLVTHLACADDIQVNTTVQQLQLFAESTQSIQATRSIANSAGIVTWPQAHADWVRPGIMLYGSSPVMHQTRDELNLQAVMTLQAPIISIHKLKQGDFIGYGSTWQCPEDMPVAVVACGYADGYPRHIAENTPAWVNGQETVLLGRVSMDMVVIDLRNIKAAVGMQVELWGEHVSVDRIADSAGTIGYELLCNAGNNCQKEYV